MFAALRLVFGVIPEMDQSIVALAGLHDYVAAAATVATGGPAAGYELLAPEAMQPLPPSPAFTRIFASSMNKLSVLSLWLAAVRGRRNRTAQSRLNLICRLFSLANLAHEGHLGDRPFV